MKDEHSKTFSENWKAWRISCDKCVVKGNVTHLCNSHAVESINRFPCAACGIALKYSDYPNIDSKKYVYCKKCKVNPPAAWIKWLKTQEAK